jgi:indoleacetamide hydrolase
MIADRVDFATLETLEWTATEAIKHIRQGSITAECYVSHLLKRYREWKILNAITWIDESRVLESARAVDAARARGEALGPLAGLPIVVMDMIDTVGYPTTGGTAALKGNYPPRNALVTEILFRNGALLLGKTNMHELGRGVTTSNPAYGDTRNPYNLNRVPGGGAGGTAAAIAARISPAGLGTDTAGSARMPAGLCGIAGMRPSAAPLRRSWTLGSWTVTSSHDGILPISYALTAPAPMGRTVSDVALLDAIVTGVPVPAAIPLRGVRIGVPRTFYFYDLDPEIARISQGALDKLRNAGAILVDVNLGQWAVTANTTFLTVATMNNLDDLANFLATNVPGVDLRQVQAGVLSRDVQAALQREITGPVSAATAEAAMKMRRHLAAEYEEVFRTAGIAAVVCPTCPAPAPLIRPEGDGPTDTILVNGKQVPEFGTLLRNTLFAGVIGVPALAIPAALTSAGLPAGLSFSGVAGENGRLLGLGLSVEAALGRLPAPNMRTDTPDLMTLPAAAVPGPYFPTGPASPTPPASLPITPTAPLAPVPATVSRPSDNVETVLALLKQSAYLNLFGSFAVADANSCPGFTTQASMRRYDIDFRVDGCGTGICVANQTGEESGMASLNWTFPQNGASSIDGGGARNFIMNDLFTFDSDGRNRLRGTGSGRIVRSMALDRNFQVNANGNFTEGTGVFAGLHGSYVITGIWNGSHLRLYFSMRLMDRHGVCQSISELRPLESIPRTDQCLTSLAFLGEPDPEYPVQRTPSGATVHELLRAVHTDFDRGRRNEGLRATVSVGPIIAKWRTDVVFNPAGASAGSFPVRLENIKITFRDGGNETLDAAINEGFGYPMSMPGISGPLFRMTGFGPIASGTGRFRQACGTISMLAALDLAPAAFSNYYLLQLIDPNGRFRCS